MIGKIIVKFKQVCTTLGVAVLQEGLESHGWARDP